LHEATDEQVTCS